MYQMTPTDRAAARSSQGAMRLRQLFIIGKEQEDQGQREGDMDLAQRLLVDGAGGGIEVEQRHGDGDGGEEGAPPAGEAVDGALLLLDQFLDLAMLLVDSASSFWTVIDCIPKSEKGAPGREPPTRTVRDYDSLMPFSAKNFSAPGWKGTEELASFWFSGVMSIAALWVATRSAWASHSVLMIA